MENHERYQQINTASYNRFSWQHWLWRIPSDRIIVPYLQQSTACKVLDVGIGTGWYLPQFLEIGAEVVGVDMHPELCPHAVELHKASATAFANTFKRNKFDVVFSSWVSEYLSLEQLEAFIHESYTVLGNEGKLIFTTIPPKGWGWFYIRAANLKGIIKYNHSSIEVMECLDRVGFKNIEVLKLKSYVGIEWANLFVAVKA